MAYMAPERFLGWSDPRSDVYSLGLVFYELLTLRPAFTGSDSTQLVSRVVHEEPVRPRKIDRNIPPDFETVVLKAIAKDPAQRYQTAAQLAADVEALVDDRPIQARRASKAERVWRWSRRNPAVAASSAAAFVLLLALVAVLTERVWKLETDIKTMQSFSVASRPEALVHPQLLLRFGVYESLDRMALIGQFSPFLEQIAKDIDKKTGKTVRIDGQVFAGDYLSSIRKLARGELDLVRFGPVSYVQARRRNRAVQLLAMELEGGDGQHTHESYIFVRSDSGINAVSQLRGKRVAFADPYSTSGTIYFKAELVKDGLTSSDVDSIRYDRHDALINAVRDRQVDAGCTRYSYFATATNDFPGQLKIIGTVEVPNKPWVARQGLDETTFEALQDSLLEFADTHPKSRELELLKVDGFDEAKVEEYDPAEKVLENAERFD
jgi:phosphate/phosphite/phosphonate ABC transporter binding protein